MDCAGVDEARLEAAGDDAALPAEARAHIAACPTCGEADLAFARLDALLRSEPAPPAPPDLLPAVLAAVAARRTRDREWARVQALVLVVAAAVLALALGALLGGWSSPVTWADGVASAWDEVVVARVGALGALLGAAWDGVASASVAPLEGVALPAPPFVILGVLSPALVLLDWALCRRPGGRSLLSSSQEVT